MSAWVVPLELGVAIVLICIIAFALTKWAIRKMRAEKPRRKRRHIAEIFSSE